MWCKSFYFYFPTHLNSFLTPKILKMCDPIQVTLIKMEPMIVNPVVKMPPHRAAHTHCLITKKFVGWS